MTVADRATTFGLISSAVISFFVSSSAVGWRRRVGGGIVIAESASTVRLSVCLAAYFCVGAAGQVINAHLPHLRRRSDFRSSSPPRRHPDELLTSRRTRGNEWADASI